MVEAEQSPSTKEIIFKLPDGKTVVANPLLNECSGFLKDFLKTCVSEKQSEEVPLEIDVTTNELMLMNQLIEKLDEAELREHSEDIAHWMTAIPQNKETLLPIAQDVDKDVFIRGANVADYLIVYPFLAFCTFVLSERCQDLRLDALREFLNEEDDFDEDQRKIIDECPEFKNL